MTTATKEAIREYLQANGSKGGKASWRGLTKAQRSLRARKAANKRNRNRRRGAYHGPPQRHPPVFIARRTKYGPMLSPLSVRLRS